MKSRGGWIDAPPIAGSFVCNIGDMLDRMTGGLYRSTPHRVRNRSGRGRLSFPFFFDPGFDAAVEPIPDRRRAPDDRDERWDRASVHEFGRAPTATTCWQGGRVFPELGELALLSAHSDRDLAPARDHERRAAAARGSSLRRARTASYCGCRP